MMDKAKKQEYIEQMTNQFDKSEAVIVTHYQGLTMTQLDDLRSRMREHGIQFKITKNRITKLSLFTSNTSTFLSFSIQDNLDFLPADKPQTTVFCSPGLEPLKIGPISNIDKSLKPLSRFLLIYNIRFEKIEFLKTPNSELIGLIIFISFFVSLK